jgi:hypothetical protein
MSGGTCETVVTHPETSEFPKPIQKVLEPWSFATFINTAALTKEMLGLKVSEDGEEGVRVWGRVRDHGALEIRVVNEDTGLLVLVQNEILLVAQSIIELYLWSQLSPSAMEPEESSRVTSPDGSHIISWSSRVIGVPSDPSRN